MSFGNLPVLNFSTSVGVTGAYQADNVAHVSFATIAAENSQHLGFVACEISWASEAIFTITANDYLYITVDNMPIWARPSFVKEFSGYIFSNTPPTPVSTTLCRFTLFQDTFIITTGGTTFAIGDEVQIFNLSAVYTTEY